MRWSAALASALIAGCAGFTGAAAGKATGRKPMTPPPTKAPRVAIYRSFTELSSVLELAQFGRPKISSRRRSTGYALLEIRPQGRPRNFAAYRKSGRADSGACHKAQTVA